ncbi:MAG: hypothetical protein WCZ66_07440 [Sphingomonadaceae bacterium]
MGIQSLRKIGELRPQEADEDPNQPGRATLEQQFMCQSALTIFHDELPIGNQDRCQGLLRCNNNFRKYPVLIISGAIHGHRINGNLVVIKVNLCIYYQILTCNIYLQFFQHNSTSLILVN